MRHPRALLLVAALALAGCSSPAAAPDELHTPEPAAFDLALVKSHFTDLCTNPTFDVDDACRRMKIDGMAADGSILNVPTVLNSAGNDPAGEICEFLATVHYGGAAGDDLGYDTINILDKNGGNLAACAARVMP